MPRRSRGAPASQAAGGSEASWVRWSNGPDETYPEHEHAFRKVLICVNGSIEFRLGDGNTIQLASGDRMELEPGTRHSAVVGPDGCACVEARA